MAEPSCIDCAYYIRPSWWRRFRMDYFAELCAHENARDPVTGGPTPCYTMRILKCERGQLFKPKGYDAKGHADAYPSY